MQVVKSVSAMQRLAGKWRRKGERVALVPTMGYLHRGHLSLVEWARKLVGEGRIGVSFDCPCPTCTAARPTASHGGFFLRVSVCFANPPDDGPPVEGGGPTWHREGDTFETLRLSPSILDKWRCGWHGFVGQNGAGPGEVVTC